MNNIKDIAISLDHGTGENTLRLTAQLAAKFDAHATGFVSLPPLPALQYAQSATIPLDVREQYRRTCHEHAEKTCAVFDQVMAAAGVRATSLVDDGDPGEIVTRRVKYSDLALLQQSTKSGMSLASATIDRVLLESGRPVIVVPVQYQSNQFPDRVVVAWDGSKEATRAVHDAMPVLAVAQSVEILNVTKPGKSSATDEETKKGADRLLLHLARNDIAAQFISRDEMSTGTGATIIEFARETDADLIVVGAWGHRRAWEYTFGGVTRTLLEDAELPVLMSH